MADAQVKPIDPDVLASLPPKENAELIRPLPPPPPPSTTKRREIQQAKTELLDDLLEKKLLRSAEKKGKALSEIQAAGKRFVIKRDLIDNDGRINTAKPGNFDVPASSLVGLDPSSGLVNRAGKLQSTIKAIDLRGVPQEPAILQAMEWRDQVTLQEIQGDMSLPILTPSIQRRIGPAALHNTPDLRPFFLGMMVGDTGPDSLFFAPGVMTRYVLRNASGKMPELSSKVLEAIALGQMSKAPVPSTLLIRDPKLLARLAGSNKLYKGSVEIELTLRGGVEIPPPSGHPG